MATILIIDDEPSIRRLMRTILEGDGHSVLEASNGRHGLDVYRERPVDLVITDIVMPEMDGLDLILELTRKVHNVKIIAISGGLRNETTLRMAKELGARHAFRKPFDLEAFRSAVREELVL